MLGTGAVAAQPCLTAVASVRSELPGLNLAHIKDLIPALWIRLEWRMSDGKLSSTEPLS